MKNWPSWIPSVNAWMSALVLVLLMSAIALGGNIISIIIQFIMQFLPRLGILAWLLVYLMPIALIAITHHIIHFTLDKVSPNTNSPELGKVTGFFPSLMSWWEGLYGWLVMILAFIISNAVLSLFSTLGNSPYQLLDIRDTIGHFLTISNLIKLIVAAYLYQFEALVRQHLIAVGAATSNR